MTASTTMVGHPADRLMEAVERYATPACVGIDPVFERLPRVLKERFGFIPDPERAEVASIDGELWRVSPSGDRESWDRLIGGWVVESDDRRGPSEGEIRWPGNVASVSGPRDEGLDRFGDPLKDSTPGSEYTEEGVIGLFASLVLKAVAPYVPIVKFQSACFERYGHAGMQKLEGLIAEAYHLGLQVILDVKRGDIGLSASHYAASAARLETDWVTANPYLGLDPVLHYLDAQRDRGYVIPGRPRRGGLGAFALVRTSNPAGDAIQGQRLEDGRSVAESIADLVAEAGQDSIGESGYSSLGAVVGATQGAEHVALRARMPQQVFLVPGFGAQGAGLDDVLGCFNSDGRGAIVTSSRSIIYAWDDESDPGWQQCVADAAAAFADNLGRAVGLRT